MLKMREDGMTQVRGQVIELNKSAQSGPIREVLKVYDVEDSTRNYNTHHIVRVAERDKYVIAEKPYSLHPDDSHLTVVLAFHGSQYVTWVANIACGGFHYGKYFDGNYEKAFLSFLERGGSSHPDIAFPEADKGDN